MAVQPPAVWQKRTSPAGADDRRPCQTDKKELGQWVQLQRRQVPSGVRVCLSVMLFILRCGMFTLIFCLDCISWALWERKCVVSECRCLHFLFQIKSPHFMLKSPQTFYTWSSLTRAFDLVLFFCESHKGHKPKLITVPSWLSTDLHEPSDKCNSASWTTQPANKMILMLTMTVNYLQVLFERHRLT